MTWYFFESQNRELRTCPSGFGAAPITDFTWNKDWTGQQVNPGDVLATVTFAGGVTPKVFVTAPPGCSGIVERTFDLDKANQASPPSQLLLYLA